MDKPNGILALGHVFVDPLRRSPSPEPARDDVRLRLAQRATPSPYSASLDDLAALFDHLESYEEPDLDTDLAALRMDDRGAIVVPDGRAFEPTPWVWHRLGAVLGVRFDRWFARASPRDRADEVNRRLARAEEAPVRLRCARREGSGSPPGTLRALVSPGYTPIPDSLVLSAVRVALRGVAPVGVVRWDITDRTMTYVVAVGASRRLGGVAPVGDVYGSLCVRNSGVGFCALTIEPWLHRVVCGNGLTVTWAGGRAVRQRHAQLSRTVLLDALTRCVATLPGAIDRASRLLENAGHHAIDAIDQAARDVLAEARLPVRLVQDVLAAFELEPHSSTFGVVQAVTRAAHAWSPEDRVAVERAAGRWIAQFGDYV